jgi:DNA polymerase III delta prime subunit
MSSLWVEKYRPQTIEECVLPDRLKSIFQEFVNNGEFPHLILAGSSGTGKTTVAKALCEQLNMDYLFLNGSDENGIDTFRTKIKGYASSMSLTGDKKAIIIDEADYLNANSIQPALRSAMEEFEDNCRFIFTCNYKNRIMKELHSRSTVIDYQLKPEEKPKMARDFMRSIENILKGESVAYDAKVLAQFIMKHFPDFRRTINELQTYSVSHGNTVDEGILSVSVEVSLTDLVRALKERNFRDMRQWVSQHGNEDAARLYRKIYDALYNILKKESIPPAVIILAKYQYQAAFVADQELNLTACLTEMMAECEFAS